MTGLQLAASIAGGFFSVALILVLVLNEKRKGKKLGYGGPKMAYGRFWKWIILVSVFVALGLIAPKYLKKVGKEKAVAKLSIPATFSWKKKDDQYGRYPEKRESGPKNAKITRDDERNGGVFNFEAPYLHDGIQRVGYFEGEYVTDKRIEGVWWQDYPRAGGEWYLERDRVNERLFTGSHRDGGDWIPMTLKIKLK